MCHLQQSPPIPSTVQPRGLPKGSGDTGQEAAGRLSPWASAPVVRGFTLRPSPPVLCAERVVRITKTYHDIDAVTNLLDEVCQ